jgi:hypothetical protein
MFHQKQIIKKFDYTPVSISLLRRLKTRCNLWFLKFCFPYLTSACDVFAAGVPPLTINVNASIGWPSTPILPIITILKNRSIY